MNDRLTIVGVFVFSVVMITLAIPAAVPVSYVPHGQIGPRFFPNMLCWAMAIVSGALAVAELSKIWRRRNAAKRGVTAPGPSKSTDAPENHCARANNDRKTWIAAGIVVGYLPMMAWFGFIPASAAAVVASMILFGERRWWLIAVFASMTPFLTWVFATQVLHIPLP